MKYKSSKHLNTINSLKRMRQKSVCDEGEKKCKNRYTYLFMHILEMKKKSVEEGVNWAGMHMKIFFSKSIYKNLLIVITSRKQVRERRFFSFYTFLHCWNFLTTC